MPIFPGGMGAICHAPFAQEVTLLRRSNGVLAQGVYSEGASVASTIQAVVSAPKGDAMVDDVVRAAAGRSLEGMLRFSSSSEIRTLEDPFEQGHPPDMIFFQSRFYEIVKAKYVPFSQVYSGIGLRLAQEPRFVLGFFGAGPAGLGASVANLSKVGLFKRGITLDVTASGANKVYFAAQAGSHSESPVLDIPGTVSEVTIQGIPYHVFESDDAGLGSVRVEVT